MIFYYLFWKHQIFLTYLNTNLLLIKHRLVIFAIFLFRVILIIIWYLLNFLFIAWLVSTRIFRRILWLAHFVEIFFLFFVWIICLLNRRTVLWAYVRRSLLYLNFRNLFDCFYFFWLCFIFFLLFLKSGVAEVIFNILKI